MDKETTFESVIYDNLNYYYQTKLNDAEDTKEELLEQIERENMIDEAETTVKNMINGDEDTGSVFNDESIESWEIENIPYSRRAAIIEAVVDSLRKDYLEELENWD